MRIESNSNNRFMNDAVEELHFQQTDQLAPLVADHHTVCMTDQPPTKQLRQGIQCLALTSFDSCPDMDWSGYQWSAKILNSWDRASDYRKSVPRRGCFCRSRCISMTGTTGEGRLISAVSSCLQMTISPTVNCQVCLSKLSTYPSTPITTTVWLLQQVTARNVRERHSKSQNLCTNLDFDGDLMYLGC